MNPMNTTVEYELTFLARAIPAEVHSTLPERMVDVYVPEDPELHPQLRLRRRADKYEITKKTIVNGTDSSVMQEQTLPLERAEFESLASGHHRLVEKDRYRITIQGFSAEVDVFSGALEGLVLIDFEFTSLEAKAKFVPLPCCLADVTQELFTAGGMLAGKRYEDIAPELAKFGYQRLFL